MKEIILFGLVLGILVLSGCSNLDLNKLSKEDVNKIIVCEKPYIRHASECCLDQNDNKICDKDETQEIPRNETLTESPKTEVVAENKSEKPAEYVLPADKCVTVKFTKDVWESYTEQEPYTDIEYYYVTEKTTMSCFDAMKEGLNKHPECLSSTSLGDITCSGQCYKEQQVQKQREVTKYRSTTKSRLVTSTEDRNFCGESIRRVCTVSSEGQITCPESCEETSLGDIICQTKK